MTPSRPILNQERQATSGAADAYPEGQRDVDVELEAKGEKHQSNQKKQRVQQPDDRDQAADEDTEDGADR